MSVAGIAAAGLSQLANIQRSYQQVRGEFKQLGQDLQAGNLTHAETDFVTLSQSVATQLAGNSPAAKALSSLGQTLQPGNLSAAQLGLASMPSHTVGPSTRSQGSPFSQAMTQLGQALHSGNLTAAQQAFSAMQQSWQQMEQAGSTAGANAVLVPSVSSSVNMMG